MRRVVDTCDIAVWEKVYDFGEFDVPVDKNDLLIVIERSYDKMPILVETIDMMMKKKVPLKLRTADDKPNISYTIVDWCLESAGDHEWEFDTPTISIYVEEII